MSKRRSAVTYSARAKLLSLLDGKFGILLESQNKHLRIQFLSEMPRGSWVLVEKMPRVFVDHKTFRMLEAESSIDYSFERHEFILRRESSVVPAIA